MAAREIKLPPESVDYGGGMPGKRHGNLKKISVAGNFRPSL
jgi:hypothetical protein